MKKWLVVFHVYSKNDICGSCEYELVDVNPAILSKHKDLAVKSYTSTIGHYFAVVHLIVPLPEN